MSVREESRGAITHAASALDANPLFHMSLGSKELFHSNFLWWLARTYPDAARAVFGAWSRADATQTIEDVEREGNDLDVIFRFHGRAPLVVENKVFSLPDVDQLERYARDKAPKLVRATRGRGVPQQPPTLVLLTMADPGWPAHQYVGVHGTWHVRRYADLARELATQVDRVKARSTYDGETLALYCNFVATLCELHELVRVRSLEEGVDLDEDLIEALERRRIGDGLKKLRMHDIGRRVKERVARVAPSVRIETALTNKKPLVEGFCSLDGTNDLGWQYQDRSFRLAMRVNQHRDASANADALRRAFVRSHPGWFDFEAATRLAGPSARAAPGRARVAEGDFHKFDHFLYRHHRPSSISVAVLLDLAEHYSQAAVAYASRNTSAEGTS